MHWLTEIGRDHRRDHDRNGHGWRRFRNGHGEVFFYPVSAPISYPYYTYPYFYLYPYYVYVNGPPPLSAAPRRDLVMNYGYPQYGYGMVGQDGQQVIPAPGPQMVPQMVPYPRMGYYPMVGPVVPSLAANNVQTHRVLAVADAVDIQAAPLRPIYGISPQNQQISGLLEERVKICKKGCHWVFLRNDLPFHIKKLRVRGHHLSDFKIELIASGQKILTTGKGFSARYLKSGHHHDFHFNVVADIDFQHPLKILVHNKSNHSHHIEFLAEGDQLAE
jgi:hypothetical protein